MEDIKNSENQSIMKMSQYKKTLSENIQKNLQKYSDIINLEHHVSCKYPQMSISDRAAQFAPFAALVGYGDAVKECEDDNIGK